MPEYDCHTCKRWKHCPGKDWFHYGEIRWCPYQIIWILQNAATLDEGTWVVDKNLTDESDRRALNEAYYVKAKITIAEVRVRLAQHPDRGEILVTQIEDGRNIVTLSDGAYEILMYVKGKNRKVEDFNAWKRKRKFRQKETLASQSAT